MLESRWMNRICEWNKARKPAKGFAFSNPNESRLVSMRSKPKGRWWSTICFFSIDRCRTGTWREANKMNVPNYKNEKANKNRFLRDVRQILSWIYRWRWFISTYGYANFHLTTIEQLWFGFLIFGYSHQKLLSENLNPKNNSISNPGADPKSRSMIVPLVPER